MKRILITVGIILLMAIAVYNRKWIGDELMKELQYGPGSPGDHIQMDQILVYEENVVLNQSNVHWSRVAPTGSMKPSINEYSNLLEVIPTNESELKVGDIISYANGDDVIVHRIIKEGKDEKGNYWIVRGDANWIADPYIIRFEDIRGLVVGVIY